MTSIAIKIEQTIQRWRDENSHIFIVWSIYGLRSIYNSIMKFLFFKSVVSRIKNTGPVGDLDELFNLASRGWYGMIAPIQSRYEFISLLRTISNSKPARLLEIGTASGGTLFMFTRIASEEAMIVSVDLPGGTFGGGYPPRKIPLYSAFALPRQQLKLIRADSHATETFEQVKEYFSEQPVDFIFVDGDHTYEGVRGDFEMYRKLIKKGGFIAFHDTEYAEGVSRFWSEIKGQYEHKWEFISANGPRYGIGLLQID
jgi:cephalosporin hydroxylase